MRLRIASLRIVQGERKTKAKSLNKPMMRSVWNAVGVMGRAQWTRATVCGPWRSECGVPVAEGAVRRLAGWVSE